MQHTRYASGNQFGEANPIYRTGGIDEPRAVSGRLHQLENGVDDFRALLLWVRFRN